ncbi:MAG: hypothetical protein LBT29_08755 [Flavobacteriaceae bacterium]|nr:hypothetical protein [Flavobacteriaceae bacterium]
MRRIIFNNILLSSGEWHFVFQGVVADAEARAGAKTAKHTPKPIMRAGRRVGVCRINTGKLSHEQSHYFLY